MTSSSPTCRSRRSRATAAGARWRSRPTGGYSPAAGLGGNVRLWDPANGRAGRDAGGPEQRYDLGGLLARRAPPGEPRRRRHAAAMRHSQASSISQLGIGVALLALAWGPCGITVGTSARGASFSSVSSSAERHPRHSQLGPEILRSITSARAPRPADSSARSDASLVACRFPSAEQPRSALSGTKARLPLSGHRRSLERDQRQIAARARRQASARALTPDMLVVTSAHVPQRGRIPPTEARSASSKSRSCKHKSDDDGQHARTTAPGVIHPPVSAGADDCFDRPTNRRPDQRSGDTGAVREGRWRTIAMPRGCRIKLSHRETGCDPLPDADARPVAGGPSFGAGATFGSGGQRNIWRESVSPGERPSLRSRARRARRSGDGR